MRKFFVRFSIICSSIIFLSATVSAAENKQDVYTQLQVYSQLWLQPIVKVINPEALSSFFKPNTDENKYYVTVDGIQKAPWSERIQQRNNWRNKNVFENINIDNVLRLNNDDKSDHVFTVSDGIQGLDPTNPDTAYDAVNQRYLVVWEEETSAGHFDIMGQFRDRNGSPVGMPSTISTARTTQGCFYAAFDTENGAISTPGNCPKAANPSVAFNNGRYLITWELKGRADIAHNSDASDNDAGKNFSNIIAKVVSADNLSPVSPAWQEGIIISRVWIASNVGTPVANDAQVQAWAQSLNPDVAPKLGADGFVITWQSDKDFIGCVDSGRRASSSIFGRYVDQNFSPTGGAGNKPIFAVYTDPSTVTATCPTLDNVMKAVKPRIAYNSTRSDFAVAFEQARANGATKGDIAAKKVVLNNSNDATVSNSMAVDIVAAAAEGTTYHNPDLASFADKTFLAYDDGTNISLRKINTNATSVITDGEAVAPDLGAGTAKTEPRMGGNVGVGGVRSPTSPAPQRVLLAYTQDGNLKAAVLDDQFMRQRPVLTVSGTSTTNHLAEVASEQNNFLVVWAGTPPGSMIENVFGAAVNSQDDLAAPVLTAPANAASLIQTNVNLTWNAVVGTGIVYDVYLGSGGGPLMTVSTGQAATSFMVNSLTWGTAYQWRVVVRDSLGRTGNSETRNFSTIEGLNPPVLTAPAVAAVVSTASVNLTWNAVAGAGIVYDVYHSVGGAPLAIVSTGQAGVTYNLMGLTSQTSHQWKVIVRDALLRSADSGPRSFTVGNINMPTAPVLDAQPADNATWAPTRLYLSWAGSTDADVGDTVTYDVYFEPVAGAMDPLPMGAMPYRSGIAAGTTSFVIQASTDGRVQFQPNGLHAGMQTFLAPNSNYAWKVCANDGRNNPAGITCSPVRHFNTDNSVVGWWRFDTNPVGVVCPAILGGPIGGPGETVCDYSGFGNHGVPNGGPVWIPPPDPMLLGGTLQFDGVNDYVEVADSPSLNPNLQISIETWQNLQSFGISQDRPFVAKVTSGAAIDNTGYSFGFGWTSDVFFFIGNRIASQPPSMIGPGVWGQFVATYDGVSSKIYHDATLMLTVPVSGSINANIQPLWIGHSIRLNSYFNGAMSETLVYSKSIQLVEINNNFLSQ